jgi:S-disulfanyl-L-cysteine oxidoreductase SoxD
MLSGMSRSIILITVAFVTWALAAESRSIWEGVSSKAQLIRGMKVYREECLRCHAENFLGGEDSPALVGEEFLEKWYGRTVGDFFERTRKTMPTDGPGNLSRRQYVDVIAYVLSANKFPLGDKDIEPDLTRLQEIRIEAKKK